MASTKNRYFRIATEGATSDGRDLSRDWIAQMAQNYDRNKYGARVNLEHFRGILPDGPFKSYGDVLSLKAEDVTIDGQKRLALLAEIDPTPELVELAKKRQKIYTSAEIDINFAKSGEAYLVGLAVTDSPASLGTEMLKFAATTSHNPLAARKQKPDNLFTAALEIDAMQIQTQVQIQTNPAPDTERGLYSLIKDFFTGQAANDVPTPAPTAVPPASTPPSPHTDGGALAQITQLARASERTAAAVQILTREIDRKLTANETTLDAVSARLDALQKNFNEAPDTLSTRDPSLGGGDTLTDC